MSARLALCLTAAAALAASDALADPVGACGPGKPCRVQSLTATKSSGVGITCTSCTLTGLRFLSTQVVDAVGLELPARVYACFNSPACNTVIRYDTSGFLSLQAAVSGILLISATTSQQTFTESLAGPAAGIDLSGGARLDFLGLGSTSFNAGTGSATRGGLLHDTTFLQLRQWDTAGWRPVGTAPHPTLERRMRQSFFDNESTTLVNNGWGTGPTETLAAASTANNNDATRYHTNYVTTAAAGGTSSLRAGTTVQLGYKPRLSVNVRTDQSAVTSTRIWIGFTDRTVAQMNADDPASAQMCAFRYATDASDTVWQACSKDATTLGCTSTGITVAAATSYTLRIEADGTTCTFWVNGLYTTRRIANLPTSTTNLRSLLMVEARAASARNLGWNNFVDETR